jgi:hypothetical protein
MIAVGVTLWLLVGIVTGLIGMQTPTVVLASTAVIAVIAILAGGYVSVQRITPNSLLHPVLAGIAVSMLCLSISTKGDLELLSAAVVAAAALFAAIGAALGRSRTKPPNNRWSGR